MLLRHTLADGSSHIDWMLEQPGAERLITFRLDQRIDQEPREPFPAERLADHRRRYLDYEGPISGGRGEVIRLAQGTCSFEYVSPERIVVCIKFGLQDTRLEGRCLRGSRWEFRPQVEPSGRSRA